MVTALQNLCRTVTLKLLPLCTLASTHFLSLSHRMLLHASETFLLETLFKYHLFKAPLNFSPMFSIAGRGFLLKMCTTTAVLTTGATMSCPSPSVLTVRMTSTSLPTATPTHTPGCSTTWPAWSAGTCPTCRGSSWASVW